LLEVQILQKVLADLPLSLVSMLIKLQQSLVSLLMGQPIRHHQILHCHHKCPKLSLPYFQFLL
jgi:hypothetical protein